MAATEPELEVGNYAYIVNCVGNDDCSTLPLLLGELTDDKVSPDKSPVEWQVDNKYYSATIELFVCAHPDHDAWGSKGGFLGRERVYQAIVFLCQLDKAESVDTLKLLWTRIQSQEAEGENPLPDVRVVVGVASDAPSDSELLQWCVGEGIELITWERGQDGRTSDSGSDDGLPPEAEGVARLAETLQAHMWPNIVMKGRDPTSLATDPTPKAMSKSTIEQEASGVTNDTSKNTCKPTTVISSLEDLESKAVTAVSREEHQQRVDSLLADVNQEHQVEDEDPGGESFESLFSRFADMKQHAESLPHEERKVYAEKVVMAFWNAIGGDDEIADNSVEGT